MLGSDNHESMRIPGSERARSTLWRRRLEGLGWPDPRLSKEPLRDSPPRQRREVSEVEFDEFVDREMGVVMIPRRERRI